MLVPILSLCLVVRIGNAHPEEGQPSITRLLARQNTATATAFKPPVTSSFYGSCKSHGWGQCGSLCIDSKNGATCCNPRISYRCIPGTYCLFDGLCCPNEVDPETCASNSGLKLPASFSRPAKYPSSTQASSTHLPISSSASKAPPKKPTTTYPEPSSYPTVNEDSIAPTEAAPVTTTYGPITATLSNSPVTLSYSGEVLPLQTVANHKPGQINTKGEGINFLE
ncbi:hypothetical protein B9Z19DRAFT_1154330 [Tuber borchii]|uniref:Granulins domain-containing protein n=1 Tax=Tuber borchii TaxID=42251 RepID=A0A2T7A4F0_TUBBO|nr:hypothetical protein B9Z19DRAFT_1154330 [Tuber borchii]